MRLKLTEDPKEWRKAAWFGALGFALLSSVLRWRHVLTSGQWAAALGVLATLAIVAGLWPRAFRGYYRITRRVAFGLIEILGRAALVVFFFFVLTPLGLILRRSGKDPLRLKRSANTGTYWTKSKEDTSLESLF